MAEILPLNFPIPAENAIASYNWINVADGTGIIHFKGFTSNDGTLRYNLGTEDVYSHVIETAADRTGDTAWYKNLDLDFDLSAFNSPRIIKGTAMITWGSYGYEETSTGTQKIKWTFKIRKWDGSTESEIANATSEEITLPNAATDIHAKCITITIPLTSFKIGEILRLTVEGYTYRDNAGGNTRIALAHDPTNRDGTYINPSTDDPETTTKLDFYCPFEVNL